MNGINKKIGTATKWSSVTELFAKLVAPITNAILARLLTPEAFGAVATITMIISFAEIFADAGFQKYIIQHEFRDETDLNESTNVAFWTNFMVSAVLWGIIILYRNQLATWAGNASLGAGVAVASAAMLMISFSSIQTARFKRDFNFKALFFVRMVAAFTPLIITVPLALILRNYWALIIGTLISQMAQAVILTIQSKWKPRLSYSFRLFKEMLSFSMWTLLESISIWTTNYIGTFIVGSFLSDYYLGLYKTSMATVNAYMAIITGAITPVLFSALSRMQNDDETFKNIYLKFQRMVALLVFPMSAGLYLYRDLATSILLGSQWNEAANFVGLWSLMSGITIVFSHFNSEVFRSKGKPKISLLVQIIHLSALIPTLLITAKQGFEPLYIARSLIRFQLIITGSIFLWWLCKITPWQVLRNVTPAFVATMVMVVCVVLLKLVSTNVLWSFVSITACAVIYFAVVFAIPSTRRELCEISFINKIVKKLHITVK